MLRYFYLIIFLVCIKWCICYDYVQNQNLGYKFNDRQLGRISDTPLSHRRLRNKDEKKRRSISQDYKDLDNSGPVAQFDLVDFLQRPSHGRDRDDPDYIESKDHKRDERQSELNSIDKPILKPNYEENDNAELSDLENIDNSFLKINQELNLSGPDIRQLYPTALIHKELNIGDVQNLDHKPFKRNSETEPFKVHKQHKKCLSNHFKIPFFSHKKDALAHKNLVIAKNANITTEPKRTEETKVNANFVTSSFARDRRKIKRSFPDLLCPVCKHRFTIDELEPIKDSQDNPIQNSRQYYQRIRTREVPTTELREPKVESNQNIMSPMLDTLQKLSFKYVDKSPFMALEDVTDDQKLHQMKEIAEVERKLSTKINSTG